MSTHIYPDCLSDLPLHGNFSVFDEEFYITHLNVEQATELKAVALVGSLRVNCEFTLAVLFHCKFSMTNKAFPEKVFT